MSRCRFVADHQADYPVTRLCKLAGVSRSGFYAWRCRTPSKRALANGRLLEEIRDIHQRSRGTYGRVKILGQLERRGLSADMEGAVSRVQRWAPLGAWCCGDVVTALGAARVGGCATLGQPDMRGLVTPRPWLRRGSAL